MAAGTADGTRPSAAPVIVPANTKAMSARLSSTAPWRVGPPPRRASTPSKKSVPAATANSAAGSHRHAGQTRAPGSNAAAPRRTTPSAAAAQEDVERARTAVAGARGGEAEHDARRAPAREPRLEPLLQHRRLVLRVVAAAVHDEHAAMPEDDRLREKAIHRDACGLRRH